MLGENLAHYRILAKLGAGGMGEVYRAEDTRLRREVALKVLPAEMASDSQRLARFRREAQILAGLDHPGIVTIFSVEEAKGIHFFTMQLVTGTTLDTEIGSSGLPPNDFFHITDQLIDAVAAAHEKGVIHRDIKPSNIMLTRERRIKVLDFGLAKPGKLEDEIAGEEKSGSYLSNEGVVIGTLPYMSPEQISAGTIDHRSDIFSIGIVLYEMATGRRPFKGPTTAALMWAICRENPDLAALPAGMEAIAAIIDRCLQKDPARRIQSVREIQSELNKARKQFSNATVLATNAVTISTTPAVSTDRSIAVLPFASLSVEPDDQFFADGVSEEIINALGRLPDLKVVARTSSFSFKGKNEDLRIIGEKLGVQTVLEGSVRRSAKRLRITAQLVDVSTGYHLWSERYDREWTDIFEIQDEIARSIASRLSATLSGAFDKPFVHHGTNDVEAFRIYTQAQGLLEQRTPDEMRRAISFFHKVIGRDAGYAQAWAGLADALLLLQDYGHAPGENLLHEAQEAIDRSLHISPELAEAHGSLALLHMMRGEGSAAARQLKQAIESRPSYAQAHDWLAWISLLLGDSKSALESGRRAVELNPLSPEALSNLSLAYLANNDYPQALREARRSKEIQPYFETSSFYEGITLYHMKKFDEAKATLQKIVVPWAGAGALCGAALAELASGGDVATARKQIDRLKDDGELACVGLLHAALGETTSAYEAFESVKSWTYWPTLCIHHLYNDFLGAMREEDRYRQLVKRVHQAWGLT